MFEVQEQTIVEAPLAEVPKAQIVTSADNAKEKRSLSSYVPNLFSSVFGKSDVRMEFWTGVLEYAGREGYVNTKGYELLLHELAENATMRTLPASWVSKNAHDLNRLMRAVFELVQRVHRWNNKFNIEVLRLFLLQLESRHTMVHWLDNIAMIWSRLVYIFLLEYQKRFGAAAFICPCCLHITGETRGPTERMLMQNEVAPIYFGPVPRLGNDGLRSTMFHHDGVLLCHKKCQIQHISNLHTHPSEWRLAQLYKDFGVESKRYREPQMVAGIQWPVLWSEMVCLTVSPAVFSEACTYSLLFPLSLKYKAIANQTTSDSFRRMVAATEALPFKNVTRIVPLIGSNHLDYGLHSLHDHDDDLPMVGDEKVDTTPTLFEPEAIPISKSHKIVGTSLLIDEPEEEIPEFVNMAELPGDVELDDLNSNKARTAFQYGGKAHKIRNEDTDDEGSSVDGINLDLYTLEEQFGPGKIARAFQSFGHFARDKTNHFVDVATDLPGYAQEFQEAHPDLLKDLGIGGLVSVSVVIVGAIAWKVTRKYLSDFTRTQEWVTTPNRRAFPTFWSTLMDSGIKVTGACAAFGMFASMIDIVQVAEAVRSMSMLRALFELVNEEPPHQFAEELLRLRPRDEQTRKFFLDVHEQRLYSDAITAVKYTMRDGRDSITTNTDDAVTIQVEPLNMLHSWESINTSYARITPNKSLKIGASVAAMMLAIAAGVYLAHHQVSNEIKEMVDGTGFIGDPNKRIMCVLGLGGLRRWRDCLVSYRCKKCKQVWNLAEHLKVHMTKCCPKETDILYEFDPVKFIDILHFIPPLNLIPVSLALCGLITNFRCTKCKREFDTIDGARLHTCCAQELLRRGESDGFSESTEVFVTCKQCPKQFKTQEALDAHCRSKHLVVSPPQQEAGTRCRHCKWLFPNRKELETHMSQEHPTLFIDPEGHRSTCHICHARYDSKDQLNQHMVSSHTENIEFKCDVCNSSFDKKWQLTRHIKRVHFDPSAEDIYHCAKCDRPFFSVDAVKAHLLASHKIVGASEGAWRKGPPKKKFGANKDKARTGRQKHMGGNAGNKKFDKGGKAGGIDDYSHQDWHTRVLRRPRKPRPAPKFDQDIYQDVMKQLTPLMETWKAMPYDAARAAALTHRKGIDADKTPTGDCARSQIDKFLVNLYKDHLVNASWKTKDEDYPLLVQYLADTRPMDVVNADPQYDRLGFNTAWGGLKKHEREALVKRSGDFVSPAGILTDQRKPAWQAPPGRKKRARCGSNPLPAQMREPQMANPDQHGYEIGKIHSIPVLRADDSYSFCLTKVTFRGDPNVTAWLCPAADVKTAPDATVVFQNGNKARLETLEHYVVGPFYVIPASAIPSSGISPLNATSVEIGSGNVNCLFFFDGKVTVAGGYAVRKDTQIYYGMQSQAGNCGSPIVAGGMKLDSGSCIGIHAYGGKNGPKIENSAFALGPKMNSRIRDILLQGN